MTTTGVSWGAWIATTWNFVEWNPWWRILVRIVAGSKNHFFCFSCCFRMFEYLLLFYFYCWYCDDLQTVWFVKLWAIQVANLRGSHIRWFDLLLWKPPTIDVNRSKSIINESHRSLSNRSFSHSNKQKRCNCREGVRWRWSKKIDELCARISRDGPCLDGLSSQAWFWAFVSPPRVSNTQLDGRHDAANGVSAAGSRTSCGQSSHFVRRTVIFLLAGAKKWYFWTNAFG